MRSRGRKLRSVNNLVSYLQTHKDFDVCTLVFSDLEDKRPWIREIMKRYNVSLSWKIEDNFADRNPALFFQLKPWDFYALFGSDEGIIGAAITQLMATGKWDENNKMWYSLDFSEEDLACPLIAACFDKLEFLPNGDVRTVDFD